MASLVVSKEPTYFAARFTAMASPCEVLIETTSEPLARRLADEVAKCAWRIEHKFSRYRDDSVIHKINSTAGTPTEVDDETANLLDFAATLTRLSDGRFDITPGSCAEHGPSMAVATCRRKRKSTHCSRTSAGKK